MDLAPTMLRLCGIGIPGHMQGIHPDRGPMQHCDYPDHLDTWREMRRLTSGEAGQRSQGLRPSLLTPMQRTSVAPTKPVEELYDLLEDPHETRNLADEPEYAETISRFRAAVASWQNTYGDLGFIPEDELLEQWRPGGVWTQTALPTFESTASGIRARSATEGARLIWTEVPPTADTEQPPTPADKLGSLAESIGAPPHDGRTWKLYCDATPPPRNTEFWIKACKLGFIDSEETRVRVPTAAEGQLLSDAQLQN